MDHSTREPFSEQSERQQVATPDGDLIHTAHELPTPQLACDDPDVVALVERAVASSDSTAWGELYDRFVDRIYRYMYTRTGSHAAAEDLSQQVFLKAWEAIGRYRWHERPFIAWLYWLGHNVYVDHLRRQRVTLSLNDEQRPIELLSNAAAAELAKRMDADVLARAINRLTHEQQQVLVFKFFDGFGTDEIARIMDKREGAVRALQMRALQSLRRVLRAQGETGSG